MTDKERKRAEEMTAEEFIRDKVREKYSLLKTSHMNSLSWYSINAEEALRWVYEFASLKVSEEIKEMIPKRDCNSCAYKKHHSPASAEEVINGMDDSYDYDYCDKDCWCGEPENEYPKREYCEFFVAE